MILDLVSIIASLASLGIKLTGRQRAYLKWRASKRGQRYFTAAQENAFYEAIEKGDVDVIDVGIHERQVQIDRLRRRLKLSCIMLGCIFLTGCFGPRIPDSDVPTAVVESLTEDERSFVVEDMTVKVKGKKQELAGAYHVVHPDFIRTFRRNQDTTLEALEQLEFYKTKVVPAAGIGGLLVGAGMVLMNLILRPKPQG